MGCPRYAGQRTAGASLSVTASALRSLGSRAFRCSAAGCFRSFPFRLGQVCFCCSFGLSQPTRVSCIMSWTSCFSRHQSTGAAARKAARSRVLRIGGEAANAFTLGESVSPVHRPNLKREFKIKYCSARSGANGEQMFCISRASRFLRHERANPSIKRTVKGLRPSPAAYVKR